MSLFVRAPECYLCGRKIPSARKMMKSPLLRNAQFYCGCEMPRADPASEPEHNTETEIPPSEPVPEPEIVILGEQSTEDDSLPMPEVRSHKRGREILDEIAGRKR